MNTSSWSGGDLWKLGSGEAGLQLLGREGKQ